MASVCLGLIAATGATITAVQPGLSFEAAASLGVLPPVFAVLGAVVGYLLFNREAGFSAPAGAR